LNTSMLTALQREFHAARGREVVAGGRGNRKSANTPETAPEVIPCDALDSLLGESVAQAHLVIAVVGARCGGDSVMGWRQSIFWLGTLALRGCNNTTHTTKVWAEESYQAHSHVCARLHCAKEVH
jgi:hypothetical protein